MNNQRHAASSEVASFGLEALQTLKATVEGEGSEGWRRSWSVAAELGLFRDFLPADTGGQGLSATDLADIMVTLGETIADNGFTMALNSHLWTVQQPLVAFGSPEQKAKYLDRLVSGDMVGAFALTEQNAGSDALAMAATAEPRDGGYLLNANKVLVGMAPVADIAIVFASTAPERGAWGLSAFLVEAGDVGVLLEPHPAKMGLSTIPFGRISLTDCWVAADRRLGSEGSGARIIQATLDWERCFILAPHVGAMARQLAACTDFADEREVFGQPIAGFQSVSNRLADMRVRLETSRLMLREAARLYDAGEPLSQFAAMTNLHVSEAFLASSLDAVRTFGGAGYFADAQVNTDLRDAVGGVIYSGTSDIQRGIVAKLEQQFRRRAKQMRDQG